MQSYSLWRDAAGSCLRKTNCTSGKHNPFISYKDVQSNPARVANIVDFSQFATDLANNTVPNYVWISPEPVGHDMHGRGCHGPADPCDFSQVAGANLDRRTRFLLNTVNAIMTSKAWTGKLRNFYYLG